MIQIKLEYFEVIDILKSFRDIAEHCHIEELNELVQEFVIYDKFCFSITNLMFVVERRFSSIQL